MWASFSLSVSEWGYRVMQSFVFAIEEINKSAELLSNLTLGFSIRNSGDSVHGALYEMMGFLTGQDEPIPNYTCQYGSAQAALVGDTRSSLSVSMARLLGLYKFPQVSCLKPYSLVNVVNVMIVTLMVMVIVLWSSTEDSGSLNILNVQHGSLLHVQMV